MCTRWACLLSLSLGTVTLAGCHTCGKDKCCGTRVPPPGSPAPLISAPPAAYPAPAGVPGTGAPPPAWPATPAPGAAPAIPPTAPPPGATRFYGPVTATPNDNGWVPAEKNDIRLSPPEPAQPAAPSGSGVKENPSAVAMR